MATNTYQYVCNNILHDLTLIKNTVTRFVGAGGFLIILATIRTKHVANYNGPSFFLTKH
jgi:hypothetical protein